MTVNSDRHSSMENTTYFIEKDRRFDHRAGADVTRYYVMDAADDSEIESFGSRRAAEEFIQAELNGGDA